MTSGRDLSIYRPQICQDRSAPMKSDTPIRKVHPEWLPMIMAPSSIDIFINFISRQDASGNIYKPSEVKEMLLLFRGREYRLQLTPAVLDRTGN